MRIVRIHVRHARTAHRAYLAALRAGMRTVAAGCRLSRDAAMLAARDARLRA